MKRILKWTAAVLLTALLLVQPAMAAVTSDMMITQVEQDATGVVLYANLMDSLGGASGESFPADRFTVLINGEPVTADSVENYAATGKGIHYVVCVDVSKSLNAKDMEQIRLALTNLVTGGITSADRMSIITFGTTVQRLVTASADGTALLSAVNGLQPTDMQTQLYEALYTAVSLARTASVDVPSRGVVIMLTDGTDDPNPAKEGAYTYENIVNIVDESNVPVYTVAVRKDDQVLDNLRHFADISGGHLAVADNVMVSDELGKVQSQTQNTTLVHAPMFNINGATGPENHSFMLELDTGSGVISARDAYNYPLDWNVVPVPSPTPSPTPMITPVPTPEAVIEVVTTPPPTVPPTPVPTPEPTQEPTPSPEPTPDNIIGTVIFNLEKLVGPNNLWILLVAALLMFALLVLIIVLVASKSKKKKKSKPVGHLQPVNNDAPRGGEGSEEGTIRRVVGGGAMQPEDVNGTQRRPNEINYGNPPVDTTGNDTSVYTPVGGGSSGGTVRIDKHAEPPVAGGGTVRIAPKKKTGIELNFEEHRDYDATHDQRRCVLEKQIVIGRLDDCDLTIRDEAVSGTHLKITKEPDGLYVADMNSSNGTIVNGDKLVNVMPLRSGDEIVIGRTTLIVRF